MATRTKGGLQFFADFSGVAKSIGNAWGMMDAIEHQDYQESLIKTSFNMTNIEFNTEAAAYASAGGGIKHMYEWGTVGINKSPTNIRPNPMSERARLWAPHMEGHGLNQQLDFFFKPSVAIVPKPKAGETGMSPDVIERLGDHVFWNKAMVMESGMTVTIRPIDKEFLLLPFYKGQPPLPSARPNDYKRGYMLSRGPTVFRPGARTAGRFNEYWVQFWENRGNDMLNATVQRELDTDYELATKGENRQEPLRPPMPQAVASAIKADRKKVERNARDRAARAAKKAEAMRLAE